MGEPQVLYGDYNGHLRPLNLMYFSLDSRCLVADHPESVAEEVESHFCPKCNGLFTTPDAISAENRCPLCYQCPCCGSALSPAPVSLDGRIASSSSRAGRSFCLQCLYCQWTSEDAGVVAPDPASLAEVAAAAAGRDREGGGGSGGSAAVIDALLKAAKQREAAAAAGARGGGGGARLRAGSGSGGGGVGGASGGATSSLLSAASSGGASATGPWKVADLEAAVALRNEAVAAASRSAALPPPAAAGGIADRTIDTPTTNALNPWTRRGDTAGPDPALWTLAAGHEAAGLTERMESSWSSSPPPPVTMPSAGRDVGVSSAGGDGESDAARRGGSGSVRGGGVGWCPRRVRLRTRLGKRCRKDLAAGRTGILIKATFNPLEGDSSTAKKGVKKKWFKKDCSAALFVPRITVTALPSSAALLKHGVGEGKEAAEAAAGNGPPPSLVLRLANPQQDTLLRLRVAQDDHHTPAPAAEGGASAGGGEAATGGSAAVSSVGGDGGDGGAASATAPCVVTVRPEGWREGDLLRLEGKEDEVLRQPGERHRLPAGALARMDGGGGDGDAAAATGDEEGSPRRTDAARFLVHQEGDVAWVRVPFDRASVDRVAAAAAGATGASARASLVVDVRFSLVMGEGEGGGGRHECSNPRVRADFTPARLDRLFLSILAGFTNLRAMLDLAVPGNKMPGGLLEEQQQQQQQQQHPEHNEDATGLAPNPGTPLRKPSSGKEEDAMWSLMKLATPVKSPGLRAAGGGFAGAGAGAGGGGGSEMTPVSLFNKSRQPGEMGGQLQSPFQSPFKNFQFSPSCLFSPPGAGTLDFPLVGGDTPGGPNARSELWQQTTPDRRAGGHRGGGEVREGRGGGGAAGGGSSSGDSVGGGSGSSAGGEGGVPAPTTPGSCGKRKGKALFTDRRGPQDHHHSSHGLGGGGQGWCLGTPMRSARESGVVHHHLGVTDIPATPDRTAGADGSQVLPPTPQLLPPPTTPSRAPRDVAGSGGGGDDAAGILMGLRSPESLPAFHGGSGSADHALFSGLDGTGGSGEGGGGGRGGDGCQQHHQDRHGHHVGVDRVWRSDWESSRGGSAFIGRGASAGGGGGGRAPHSAPAKRHRSSVSVSLRDAHCKGSFTIERGTLIRSSSTCSSSVGASGGGGKSSTGSTSSMSSGTSVSSASSSTSSASGTSGTSRDTGGGDETGRGSDLRGRSRGQSIEDEPLSPSKPPLSPGPPPLAMSRRSVSLSPARQPSSRRTVDASVGGTPSSRGARGDRSRRGAASEDMPGGAHEVRSGGGVTTSSIITPSPAAAPASRSGRASASRATPSRGGGSSLKAKVKGTPPRSSSRACKAELESSSFHSPEPTTSTSASLRRGRGGGGGGGGASAQKSRNEKHHQQASRTPPTRAASPKPSTTAAKPAAAAGNSTAATASSSDSDSAETLISGPGGGGGGGSGGDPSAVACNCKKSKCLKLYCECFQRRQYCHDCNCVDCLNTERTESLRQAAIRATIERNPTAFTSKFEKRAGKRSHNAGCNCKKSACLKKYCECFQAAVACGSNCKCVNCKNYEGAAGGRKRRAVEAPPSAAPRTPPRMSQRVRGAVAATTAAMAMAAAAAGADRGGDSDGSTSKAPSSSPDHHVQVGGGDDDDDEDDYARPLAETLRGSPLFSSSSIHNFDEIGKVDGGGGKVGKYP
eukprot:g6775.t2